MTRRPANPSLNMFRNGPGVSSSKDIDADTDQRYRTEHEKPWNPLAIRELAALFADASFPWWIAGGYAVEQFVGSVFRSHGDIDILLLRRDSSALRHMLSDWDLWASDPPGHLRPWLHDETLPAHVSDVWCRRHADDRWRFQLMLDDADGLEWKSRRANSVSMSIDALGYRNQDGVPFLKPEVQLFYKAKSPRPKDTQDFEHCLPLMTKDQKEWLRSSIRAAYGDEAPWLAQI